MDFVVNDDHWAFLADIEAPMWFDLSLAANSNNQDNEDSWFYTSHPFHQCSSSQLKSAFSHESSTLDSDLLGPSSPKLPPSVSKSRGKEYRSKKWKGDNKDFSLDKSHPVKVLTAKSSSVKLGDRNRVKHKTSFVHLKEASTLKSSVVCESSSSGKAVSSCSKPLSACGDPGSSLSSEPNKTSESNPTSTITFESGQQQHLKVVDVLSHTFGQTNELLLFMKKSLRKSYTTTQAKRVEINNDGKQLVGRNSTSSKSSVGSSSNPRSDLRISMYASVRPKEITPDSRNVARMASVTKSRMNAAEVVKASAIKTEERTLNNRRIGQTNTAKPALNEAAKSKVQCRNSRSKALVPSRLNEKNPTLVAVKLKKTTGSGESLKVVGKGKENVTERASVSQKKCIGRVSSGEGIAGRVQTVTRQALSKTNDKVGTIHSKGKVRGQENSEKPKKFVQRVHFR